MTLDHFRLYRQILSNLPGQLNPGSRRVSFEHYGASRVVADYCGLCYVPALGAVRWQHGWANKTRQDLGPLFVIQEQDIESNVLYLVARKDEAEFLNANGLPARPVGLPFLYAHANFSRVPNSLLVMPGHSRFDVTRKYAATDYVESIHDISSKFDLVVACVHPACRRHGYWEAEFLNAGIPVIEGAQTADMNGLLRIKSLMAQFTHLTTNSVGSHIVYGAASGLKVSVYGPYAHICREDYQNAAMFRHRDDLLDRYVAYSSESNMRSLFPFLFVDPCSGIDCTEWALNELGASHKLSPAEFRRILGWTPLGRSLSVSCNAVRVATSFLGSVLRRGRLSLDRLARQASPRLARKILKRLVGR